MADLTIRKVLDEVVAGRIRVPAFQRGFVWDADRVAYLMDSLYKRYPFGSVLLWRTKTTLRVERQLGPYQLPERDPELPIDYVLDGQQRLTSIFGVFQNEIEPNEADTELLARFRIYFDFRANPDAQESQFVPVSDGEADPERYFPLRTLFDSVEYRRATEVFATNAPLLRLIDDMQTRFKEATIPVQAFETDDRARVAIVFERVNRLGVELDTFQLLTAWTWSEDFDLQEQFEDLTSTLEPFGFQAVGEDTNLLLRCCAAIVAGDAAPDALIDLSGTAVRARFPEIRNGILGAIDFVRANFNVQALKNLPFSTLLVPLSVFFAVQDGAEAHCNDAQRHEIVRWFWRACFSRRYSSAVLRSLKTDIEEMARLREAGVSELGNFQVVVTPEFFLDNTFSIRSVDTRTFVLMLALERPLSFVSGAPVSLAEVLKDYNRTEFHHLYPQSYLRGEGYGAADIGRLVNFAFISSHDNKHLGGAAPSVYRNRMPGNAKTILRHSLCPDSLFQDDYGTFRDERAKWLKEVANHLIA
jgi:hypothetical protein